MVCRSTAWVRDIEVDIARRPSPVVLKAAVTTPERQDLVPQTTQNMPDCLSTERDPFGAGFDSARTNEHCCLQNLGASTHWSIARLTA